MKTRFFIAAMASMLLAGCSQESFVGDPTTEGPKTGTLTNAITLGGESANITRAAVGGSAAATMLGNEFRVLGTVTKGGSTITEFDNYVVKYDDTNIGQTDADGNLLDSTNVYGWYYLGLTTKPDGATQYIKYWDLNATKYDFVAFSGIDDSRKVASTQSNTFDVTRTSMQKMFVSDKVTANYTGSEGVMYGDKVGFTFSRVAARMRIGFYETVPGYAVANLRFYFDGDLLTTDPRKAKDDVKVNAAFPADGQYTITYTTKNVAMTNLAEGGNKDISYNFGKLQYQNAENADLKISADGQAGVVDAGNGEAKFLSTSSALPTWAKGAATLDGEAVAMSDWQSIMPYPSYGAKDTDDKYINRRLTIRVDYDLVPLGGGSVIHVYNASAVVPYEWTSWKPNYAYTYIFKISDQTSGQQIPPYIDPEKDTDGDGIPDYEDPDDDGDGIPDDEDPDHHEPTPDDPDIENVPEPDTENPNPKHPAVSPIVFDAYVSNITDFNQETITGMTDLGGNAITTYSATSKITDAAEYAVGEKITVSSPSHGRWGVVYSSTVITEKQLMTSNTFSYQFIAGEAADGKTIDENSTYSAEFEVEQPGYYIVWLRYLPTGSVDIESNYVDYFKVIKTHE